MKRKVLLLVILGVVAGACSTQIETGRGWELVRFDRQGPVYSTLIATTQADADRIWERFELNPPVPQIDFDEDVLIGFAHAVSSSCPEIAFRGLAIDGDHVYGTYHLGGLSLARGCTADATPAVFWLRVSRDRLPDRFTLSLTEDRICLGCSEETLEVDLTDASPSEPWWAASRIGIAFTGKSANQGFLVDSQPTTEFGNPILIVPPSPDAWLVSGQPMVMIQLIPERINVVAASCSAASCDQANNWTRGDIACSVAIPAATRTDRTVMVDFEDDGSCAATLVDGLDWPH